MAHPTKIVLLLTVLLLLKTTCEAQLIIKPTTHLQISNHLETELTVHCKSKDNDLGDKTLAPQGSFRFSFIRPNFWKSTLFSCTFVWKNGSHSFDIYIQSRDQDICKKSCNWFVKKDGSGVCRLKEGDPSTVDNCYPWKEAAHAESPQH